MKKVYYRLLLLLLNPYYNLIISIGIILFIRIYLFSEIFAQEYHILKGERNIHPYIQNNGEIIFVKNRNQTTSSLSMLNNPLAYERDFNTLMVINALNYNPNKCTPEIREAYSHIMNMFNEVFSQSTTEEELAKNCMKKIQEIIPFDVWPTTKSDFDNPLHKSNKLFENILLLSNVSVRSKNLIAENLFLNAFVVYKKALIYKLSNNQVFLEQMFLRHLETEKYGFLKNPFFKDILTDEF